MYSTSTVVIKYLPYKKLSNAVHDCHHNFIIYRASLVQEQDQGEEWNVRYRTFLQEFVCIYLCIVNIPVPYLPAQYSVVGSVPDPGSCAFLTPGSGIGFFRILDPKPILLSLATVFWVKSSIIL
jgi:hypothetical protein